MSHVRAPASLPVSLRSTCGWLALLGAAIVGCSSDEPNGPEQTGTLLVTASTSGVSSDPDGYRLTLDGKATELLSASGQATFTAVSPGPHSVVIDDIATSCTSDWYAPRPVEVIAAETTSVAFELRCTAPSPLPIVFSSTRDNIYRDIYRADESFTTVERLTSFAALGDDQPSLSPGGTRIAFIRFPGTPSVGPTSQPQIWVMDADGSNAVLLVRDTTHVVATPAWSPDGTRIVFVRWSSGDERQIVITTADGREERVLYTGYMHDSTSAWDPRWSPDGSTVSVSTFVGSVIGIRLLNVESGQGHDIALPGDSLSVTYPAWFRDGSRLVYCAAPPGSSICDIETMRPDGTERTTLAESVPGAVTFAPSPDDSKILFTGFDAEGMFDVYEIPAAGGSPTNLSSSPSHENFPSWGP